MGTGFHAWYVMRRITAEWSITLNIDASLAAQYGDQWWYCDFRDGEDAPPRYTMDQLQATPYKTKEAAELVAFAFSHKDPEFLHNVRVELR